MLEIALTRRCEPAKKPLEEAKSLLGGEMHSLQEKFEKMKLFERRLMELRRLSEAERAQLLEILRKQKLLSSSPGRKREGAPSEFVQQFMSLSGRISELQQQTKRLREHIRSVSALQSLLSRKKT